MLLIQITPAIAGFVFIDKLHDAKVSRSDSRDTRQSNKFHLGARTVAVGIVIQAAGGGVVDQVVIAAPDGTKDVLPDQALDAVAARESMKTNRV